MSCLIFRYGRSSSRRSTGDLQNTSKKTGYMFFQKSVYVKPLHNLRICAEEKAKLRPALPKEGSVSVLRMTAGSFRAIEQLLGTEFDPELYCGSVITY